MGQLVRVAALFILCIMCAGMVLGLTFLPCHATLCPEDILPLETRLHIAVFFTIVGGIAVALLLRTLSDSIHALGDIYISPELPILGCRITVGGLVLALWIIGGTLATTAFWLPAQLDFWGSRTNPLGWTTAKVRLTVSGVTGHYADILLGLLVIPVSRNSLVGQAFGLHQSTLLFAHKLIAYLFLAAAIAHGAAYAVYALDSSSDGDIAKEEAFATGNPTMTKHESETRSAWYTATTYTGAGSLVVMIIITVTAIPYIRRNHYNTFYYFHIISSILIFVGVSIHASTDFYLLLPGLFLWVLDWAWRLFRGGSNGLCVTKTAMAEDAGSGWYRISLPAHGTLADDETSAAAMEKAESSWHPLTYYYLNFPSVSRTQNHAFTAAIPASAHAGPVFLFQPTRGKPEKKLNKEWTWKLASSLENLETRKDLEVRVEGPYPPRDTRFETASHIICIVGGTGITGAYSLVMGWLKIRAATGNSKFTLVWTMKQREMANLREWTELEAIAASTPNLTLHTHVSSESGRLNPLTQIRQALALNDVGATVAHDSSTTEGAAWIYSSGPDGLLRATETACIEARRQVREIGKGRSRASVKDVNWYIATWEV
ncbi:hypothetical protein FDECE_10457 [Fusarium decemcellulare]|nr:hypothetical protein FDECE_10457 [Fusarium decemcellulare]